MVYSDVVAAGFILDRKEKYTMRDVHTLMGASLFKPHNGKTLTLEEAIFIVKCSAVFHKTDYAQSLNDALDKERTSIGL